MGCYIVEQSPFFLASFFGGEGRKRKTEVTCR